MGIASGGSRMQNLSKTAKKKAFLAVLGASDIFGGGQLH